MIPILSLYLAIASGGVSATPPAANVIQQTVISDPSATTAEVLTRDGKGVQTTSGGEQRVLIEMHEPPTLHRRTPGSFAEVARQRQQLARDLQALDRRRGAKKPSRIKREYHSLFSGVSAIVEAGAIDEIRKLPNVVAVHEDAKVRAQLTESVPMIGAITASATYAVNGTGVKVAVIDTGVDYAHPDLGGCLGAACKVISGYDYVNDDNDPHDDNGHGTHVAGTIAANGTLKGVAPGATLLAYKVLDSFGYGYNSDVIAALERAVLDGAKVANLSLGGAGTPDDPGSEAVDNATAAGMLSVVAAGNTGAYQSIGSPGTARTALTVGATDKTWNIAYFSSRGYVVDGDAYLMKPEIVAPGLDIRSTVPTSGAHGDPSRYKYLSGTSMATPHVAGAVALLLQWKPAQTPAQLKERLMNSARSVTGDVFTVGAGGIDVVKAFGGTIFASPTNISWGLISERAGTIVRDQTLTLRNGAASSQTMVLSAGSLPAGATLQFIPASVTIAANATANVTLRLTIDAAALGDPPDPQVFNTTVTITGSTSTARVPAYFMRGSILEVTSSAELPWFIHFIGPSDQVKSVYFPTGPVKILVKPGLWDVFTVYHPPCAIVVREQQNVQSSVSLNVARAEATRALTVNAVDDTGQPLYEFDFRRGFAAIIDPVPGASSFGMTISSGNNYTINNVSSRFVLGLIGTGADPSDERVYSSSWVARGISSDVVLPAAGVPFRRLAQDATHPAGAVSTLSSTWSGFGFEQSWGSLASVFRSSEEKKDRALYLQSGPATDVLVPLRKTSVSSYDGALNQIQFIDGPYFLHDGSTLTVNSSPFFTLDSPIFELDAVLGAAVERWDHDTPPHALPLKFFNGPYVTGHGTRSFTPAWSTQTAANIVRFANVEPTFELYRAGAFVGTYPVWMLGYGIASAPGLHEVRSQLSYPLGAVTGTAHVTATFDTNHFDPNPPLVSLFRIEQNGLRTAKPVYSSNAATSARVKFRATDPYGATVTLEWRQHGTTPWTPLPFTEADTRYEAALTMGGSIDLRLTATDPWGNSFREEWTPLVIMTMPPPPTTPASITATRTGPTTISLSWPPSTSSVGIANYRIERLPGYFTIDLSGSTTSWNDTGLTNGNAHFYRVTAIDANNTASAPTGFDVATLIEFDDDPLIAGLTPLRGNHIAQLRRAIDAVRYAAGLETFWSGYDPLTGPAKASDFSSLRNRLNEARTAMLLPFLNFPSSVVSGAKIRAADLQLLRNSVK